MVRKNCELPKYGMHVGVRHQDHLPVVGVAVAGFSAGGGDPQAAWGLSERSVRAVCPLKRSQACITELNRSTLIDSKRGLSH